MIRSTRTLAILAVFAVLLLTLGACGGSPAPTATAVPAPTATPVPPTDAPTPEPVAAEEVATEAPAEEAAEEAAAAEAIEAPAEEAAAEATEAPAEEAAAAEATEAPAEEAAAEATEAPAEEAAAAEATEAPVEEAAAEATEQTAEAAAETAPAEVVIVESARRVTDVVNERDVPFAAISPDGSFIAWFAQTGRREGRTGLLCLFTFANADKTCHEMPAGEFRDWPYQLQWSPDSTMIAFTENPVQLANEADIWIFTLADSSFQNLTDDGVIGSWRSAENGADALIDYLPAWNPVDGSIVFWRIKPLVAPNFENSLYKVTTDGEVTLIRDLTQDLPLQLPLFDQESFYMDGFSAVSPDGAKLATIVTAFDQFGAQQPNLWV
ncbi:MAG: hypothetical protein R6W76_14515, partial [Caldilinea sp.]